MQDRCKRCFHVRHGHAWPRSPPRPGSARRPSVRVLNDKPGVSDAARQAVLTALDVLGYERPARLRQRSAGLVGLVVPELENPIFPAFAQVIEDALAQPPATRRCCAPSPPAGSPRTSTSSCCWTTASPASSSSPAGTPTRAPTTSATAPSSRAGCRSSSSTATSPGSRRRSSPPTTAPRCTLAVSHLVQLGHRRIGLAIGPDRFVPVAAQARGLRGRAGAAARHSPEPRPRAGSRRRSSRVEGGAAAARRLLDRGATAIVCGSDLMALGAIRAVARRAGLTVPGDVSVVGFDDSPLIQFLDPPLTTVRQPVPTMALAAVAALVDAIDGQPAPPHEYLFRPELVLRSTTGRAPRLRPPVSRSGCRPRHRSGRSRPSRTTPPADVPEHGPPSAGP